LADICVLLGGVYQACNSAQWFDAQYLREIGQLLAVGGPPNPKALAEVMLRHGLVPVKPA